MIFFTLLLLFGAIANCSDVQFLFQIHYDNDGIQLNATFIHPYPTVTSINAKLDNLTQEYNSDIAGLTANLTYDDYWLQIEPSPNCWYISGISLIFPSIGSHNLNMTIDGIPLASGYNTRKATLMSAVLPPEGLADVSLTSFNGTTTESHLVRYGQIEGIIQLFAGPYIYGQLGVLSIFVVDDAIYLPSIYFSNTYRQVFDIHGFHVIFRDDALRNQACIDTPIS